MFGRGVHDRHELFSYVSAQIESDLSKQDAKTVRTFSRHSEGHIVGLVLKPGYTALDFPTTNDQGFSGAIGSNELANLFLSSDLLAADL